MKNQASTLNQDLNKQITIDGRILLCQEGESILETLERENIAAHFNCREGFCGVCRTKLLSGSVDYRIDPLAFIDDDEILTCCTYPTSHISIKVEY